MSMLKATGVTVRYGAFTAVDGLSFALDEGQWLMLIGPNGAGKSTLLGALAQTVRWQGSVELEGQDIRSFKPAGLARRIGMLSQRHQVGYAYTVEEIVRLGRYAHRNGLFSARDEDGAARIGEALRLTGMESLRHTSMLTLSGGEMQRAFLAQVFAQDPRILLLDEPANHLDLPYQKQIFSLIDQWRRQPGRAVISVVHDLSLAGKYGTHALLMDHGQCVAQGEKGSVLSQENLQTVYGMDVHGWMRDLLRQWQEPSIQRHFVEERIDK